MLVADGLAADLPIVAARGPDGTPGLYNTELVGPTVSRTSRQTIDPSRGHLVSRFEGQPAEPLAGAHGTVALPTLFDRAAVTMAFEQIGVASAAPDIATAPDRRHR